MTSKEKIKLLFIIRSLNSGGAERQLVELVKRINKKIFDIYILTFYEIGFYNDEILEFEEIKLINLDKRGRWDIYLFTKKLIKFIKEIRPDIIHGYSIETNLFALLACKLTRFGKVVWGIRYSNLEFVKVGKLSHALFKLSIAFSRFSDMTIFNSFAGKEYHESRGFKSPIMTVINNGIDTKKFNISTSDDTYLHKELSLNDKTILIAQVGRIDQFKNQKQFLDLIVLLKDNIGEGVKFLIVGKGKDVYENQLMAYAKNKGIENEVIWVGKRKDMEKVYNSIDILVSTSLTEGFPNVIAEAMACGVRCVVSNAGDTSRIISEDDVVFAINDMEGLVDGVNTMINRVRFNRFKSKKNREIILERFSCDSLVKKTENTLLELLGDEIGNWRFKCVD